VQRATFAVPSLSLIFSFTHCQCKEKENHISKPCVSCDSGQWQWRVDCSCGLLQIGRLRCTRTHRKTQPESIDNPNPFFLSPSPVTTRPTSADPHLCFNNKIARLSKSGSIASALKDRESSQLQTAEVLLSFVYFDPL
jgi:hypothetical protein